jgi:hypothetical protein
MVPADDNPTVQMILSPLAKTLRYRLTRFSPEWLSSKSTKDSRLPAGAR